MLFNSVQFAFFFVVVTTLYWALPHRGRTCLLLVASYFFYGCAGAWFLGLLAISTLLDFSCALMIDRSTTPRGRKVWLTISVVGELGILGFFKYFNFFSENIYTLLTAIGFHAHRPTLDVILPVGISFYTFQAMSYTIDVYRRRIRPTTNLLDFAVFISLFPQLVAGPIMRAQSLLPQVQREKRWDGAFFLTGLELMAWGYFKKMFVADNLAPIVDHAFNTPVQHQTALQILLGLYAFAFQIYGDFSGYSDIARGAGRCLGFDLMVNFRCPYFATNPQEFWRRWHISLSTWLRDYLYISLGGSRGSEAKTYRNLCLTMLLGGLWHGAAWTFVLWGAFHGAILVIHRLYTKNLVPHRTTPAPFSGLRYWLLVVAFFHLTCFGWLLFRAQDLHQVGQMLMGLSRGFTLGATGWFYLKALLFYTTFLIVADGVQVYRETRGIEMGMPQFGTGLSPRLALMLFGICSVLLFGSFDDTQFIYFQF